MRKLLLIFIFINLMAFSPSVFAKAGEFGLGISTGTGLLVGKVSNEKAPDSSIIERNPALLDLDFQFEATDLLRPFVRLEMTLEKGEALTIIPGLVLAFGSDPLRYFARFGVAIRTEPNYYGLDLGVGLIWNFIKHLGLTAELHAEPLFLGSGLNGGFVMPVLVLVGLRGNI